MCGFLFYYLIQRSSFITGFIVATIATLKGILLRIPTFLANFAF